MAAGAHEDPQRSRRRVFEHPARVAVVVVGLLVALNLGVWLVMSSETGAPGRALPDHIETVSPGPGDVAQAQDTITVDLRNNLTGTFVINGFEIPLDQLDRNVPLGVFSFRPGPGKDFERWNSGDVAVEVLSWPQTDDRPEEPERFGWSFRVG